jgi:hypothetical protein
MMASLLYLHQGIEKDLLQRLYAGDILSERPEIANRETGSSLLHMTLQIDS